MIPERGSPLRYRDFVLFLAVMLTSGFALEMSLVAVGWQVYAVDSNPLDLGLVGLAMFIPLPLLALPAGHLADRFPRRRILIGSRSRSRAARWSDCWRSRAPGPTRRGRSSRSHS